MPDVVVLAPDAAPDVVDVMFEAFYDYPVMRFVLGQSGDYDGRLRAMIELSVRTRMLRDEWMLGIRAEGRLAAAATISRPDRPNPPDVAEARSEVWSKLGDDARGRYETFSDTTASFEVAQPHLHLSMIGVRNRSRGSGLGRRLLDATHDLSATDPESEGVTLTTEVERNVTLYQHFGYELVGKDRVAEAFTTWGFYRKDGPDGA